MKQEKRRFLNIMISLSELVNYLYTLLNCSTINDFCPNGLQVQGVDSVQKIASAVSGSEATIKAAIDMEAGALLVHHGMFWNKDSFRILGVKKRKLELLFDNNIALLAYHLPLDCHQQYGNNWCAAKEMGWQNLEPFGERLGNSYLGVKGTFKAMPVDDFTKKLEEYYQHPAYTALGGKSTVSSAALISGGAHREITDAIKAKVDCFITGSFDEPIWHIAHEEKIHFFAMGHSNTEKIGPRALGDHLSKQFNIEHTFIDIPNPF